jgi:hypothetical protein
MGSGGSDHVLGGVAVPRDLVGEPGHPELVAMEEIFHPTLVAVSDRGDRILVRLLPVSRMTSSRGFIAWAPKRQSVSQEWKSGRLTPALKA